MALTAPTLADVHRARDRIKNGAIRTPLIPIELDGGTTVHLKLENLQPIGSFKIRGALNRMLSAPRDALADGVYTASAGNMAQGVAFAARSLGIRASVFVPDTAPRAKTDAVARLGATVVPVAYDEWWQIMQNGGRPGTPGLFVHPFADTDVMAGNGTISLEILEQEPNVDAVLVPWGGGGLTCGIAAAMRTLRPNVRVYACEVEGAAPLTASLAAGKAVTIENRKTFIDGIGGRSVFPGMWPLARELVTGALVVTERQVADAVALVVQRAHVVPEGAGAAPLAAVIHSRILPAPKHVVCVVSGGNIDDAVLATILGGFVP
jgi:threonine dehydratase